MPVLKITQPEVKDGSRFQPVKKPPPDARPIHSPNMCGLCLYNIPQGALMIVLPGFAILLIGCILLSMGHTDDSWSNDLLRAAMILIVLGGFLTLAGLIFWVVMWRKQTPKTTQQRAVSPPRQVELVAIVNMDGIPGSQGQGQVEESSTKGQGEHGVLPS